MSTYTFAIGPSVVSGPGAASTLAEWAQRLGARRPLVISDAALAQAGIAERVQASLPGSTVWAGVDAEPSVELVAAALEQIGARDADLVVAVGGGSAIDTAKLAAMLATNTGELLAYADDWSAIVEPGIPLLVVPTTVGSGSEMTRGAVFKDPARHSKLVIVSDLLAARAAILDPTLLETLPAGVTAATGSDALTQAIEGVLSTAANAFTDALHLQAIRMIRPALARAVADSRDTEAMSAMQQAAAMVGAALARSGVGAAHAVANTLGGYYPIPHGLACAVMLGPVLRMNAAAAPERCRPIAEALGLSASGANGAAAEAVVAEVEKLLAGAGVTWHLRDYGVAEGDLERIAPEAQAHSDMGTNPVEPSVDQVLALLREAW